MSSIIRTLSAGGNHNCVLTAAGEVKCWGENQHGRLGDGTTDHRSTPVDVAGLGNGARALSTGGHHTCAIAAGGGVECWGWNEFGQVGDGTTISCTLPSDVAGLDSGAQAVIGAGAHTCALMNAGGVKCWGANGSGQLGDGSFEHRHTPVDVAGLNGDVQAVFGGSEHTCALMDAGGVKCWGKNENGQLGDGTTAASATPVDVTGLGSGVRAVAAGGAHTCALTDAGSVKCWGKNELGQLGDGTTEDRHTPVDVAGLDSDVQAISAGWMHTCALTTLGGIKCWGKNENGQLGDGTFEYRTAPVDVLGLGSGMQAVAAGGEHTCALTITSRVKCWGAHGWGQLGDGLSDWQPRATPVDVVWPPTHALYLPAIQP